MAVKPRLFLFDLDGTLVHDYLLDQPCEPCHGTGRRRVIISDEGVECETCHGRGSKLEPDPERPYDTPVAMPRRRELILDLAKREGVRFGICTNQAGAALGYCTPRDTHVRIGTSIAQLDHFGGAPFTVQVSWHHPTTTTDLMLLRYRKPEPGMLTRAMALMGVMPQETIFVGDRQTDREAAERALCEYADAEGFFH
jgi:histidinol phosphatase-like enzyme